MQTQVFKGKAKLGTTNYLITNDSPLKFEVYSFIGIVSTYFSLQPILVERIKFVFNEIWNHHTTFFNTIPYENTVLGVMIFASEEFCIRNGVDCVAVDVSEFVEQLYGKNNTQKNLIQIYGVYQNIKDIFK